MFGKPEWFREKSLGWGLVPVRWQGWVYALAWSGVIAAPFLALLTTRREVEAMIWLAASLGALLWDVRDVLHGIREQRKEVLYIDEHGATRLNDHKA
jgi:hypothetical protein